MMSLRVLVGGGGEPCEYHVKYDHLTVKGTIGTELLQNMDNTPPRESELSSISGENYLLYRRNTPTPPTLTNAQPVC